MRRRYAANGIQCVLISLVQWSALVALVMLGAVIFGGCVNTDAMREKIERTEARISTLEKLVARIIDNSAKAAAAAAEAMRQIRLAQTGMEGGDE